MKSGIYKHYKGGYYQVLGIGEHTETQEQVVVYVSLDASQPGIRVRPLDGPNGFSTMVRVEADRFLGISGYLERFTYIGDKIE